MKTSALLATVLLCLVPWRHARAGDAVDMDAEPHYQRLMENDKVRVFDLTLAAHSSTQATRHDHNYLMITLCDCEIAIWAEGQAGVITYRYNRNDVRFFYGGPARSMRNDTPNEYHNLTVEFLSPEVTTLGFKPESGHWEYGSSAMPAANDTAAKFVHAMNLGTATVKDVQLLPDDLYPPPEQDASELLIALSDLELKTDRARIRKSRGEWLWMDPGRKADLRNNDVEPVRFVVIEFRQEASPGN